METITAVSARTKLGVVIGTDVQAYDAELAALAALVSAADRLSYYTGAGTAALATFTAAARTLLAAASVAAQRTTLGSTTVGDAVFIAASTAAARAAIGAIIGTDVQAQDADLSAIAGLTSAADRLPYFTGSGTASLAVFTAAARGLLDDPDYPTMLATLGAVGLATANTFTNYQTISHITPQLIFIETDATVDNKHWDLTAGTERLAIRALNDANTVASEIIAVERTGTTVDSVTIGGTTVAVTNALTVGGSFSSTRAAATGYSRVTPNMCRLNTDFAASLVGLVRDTITLVTGPTGCTGLILLLENFCRSNNAVADRNSITFVYSDSGATIRIAENYVLSREEVATAAVTLSSATSEVHVKANSSGQVWLRFSDDTGNQGTANYCIIGYYD